MHTKFFPCLLLVLAIGCNSSTETQTVTAPVTVTNPLSESITDAFVVFPVKQLETKLGIDNWSDAVAVVGDKVMPYESFDRDGDGTADEIGLVIDLAGNESKNITVRELEEGEQKPTPKKRTQAELSHKTGGYWKEREYQEGSFQNVDELHVPPEHTDHSWYIRYEGPGWESDLVGYRFYLDWRNATDIFGKKTREMVLQGVGLDGFDSYHEPAEWGQDILKVGKSLGIGSLGTWIDGKALRVEETDSLYCKILHNGALESTIRTMYFGWKAGNITTDVQSDLSIQAGSRMTRHDVQLSKPLPNLCTGINKLENGEFFKNDNGNWGYIATWGQQTLANDNLGMAVIYRIQDLQEVAEDGLNHAVILTPTDQKLTYYFLATWEQEPGGITTKKEFADYLEAELQKLSHPVVIKL